MSLLKRIESSKPGPEGGAGQPASGGLGGGGSLTPASGQSPRLMGQTPGRESFRDVKFRIQSRGIQDLDPKLDLSNQGDRKSTRLNSSHVSESRMPSSA